MSSDARRQAPAAARNRDPILAVLRQILPDQGTVLEIASGTGEHVAHFASHLSPGLTFQPSDPLPAERASIDAWVTTLGLTNVRPAIALDAAAPPWPSGTADAVLCINMVHISPWASTLGLLRGAAHTLDTGGLLYLYGPFRRHGAHTGPGNERFDADLRAKNAAWGIRDLDEIIPIAASHGFSTPEIIAMPADNLSVIFPRAT